MYIIYIYIILLFYFIVCNLIINENILLLQTEMSNMNENKKTKNAKASRSRKFNLYRKLEIGTIIWTKIGKRPLWPSIVIDEQESKTHLKSMYTRHNYLIFFFFI